MGTTSGFAAAPFGGCTGSSQGVVNGGSWIEGCHLTVVYTPRLEVWAPNMSRPLRGF